MENKMRTIILFITRKITALVITILFAGLLLYIVNKVDMGGSPFSDATSQKYVDDIEWMFFVMVWIETMIYLSLVLVPFSLLSDWFVTRAKRNKKRTSFIMHLIAGLISTVFLFLLTDEGILLFIACSISSLVYWWIDQWWQKIETRKLKEMEKSA